MYTSALVVLALGFGTALASTIDSRSEINEIMKRQAVTVDPNDFPSACQSPCTSVANTFNTCTTVSCLCTNAVSSSLASCFQCSINNSPKSSAASVESTLQQTMTGYVQACNADGTSVQAHTLTNGAAGVGAASLAILAPAAAVMFALSS
ncbi:hypothetical protein A0H81_06771 [Grifola frondosa]|uniref:Extracellular membrane protein CFEM domain-containing protein n=1 Tax=Grifola frondosa TaxID=5627 RepID=A0A1C7M9C7_GRIFR|nr:hypothetical protein A0H81_06771 [Grifola frondosa]